MLKKGKDEPKDFKLLNMIAIGVEPLFERNSFGAI